ncbi:MAG TPA: LamG-like jellyroll fold domain-containing protein [Alphaproteobacteria bacterium]|nr:LamG-like jellyroll fold domain-containing protein [Alphaproteobacteria bacterium]
MDNYAFHLHGGGYLYADPSPAFNFGAGDLTVEAWIKSFSGGTVVARKGTEGGPGNGGFLLVVRPDGTLKFATDNGFGFFEADSVPVAVIDGVWHHVAAVRQGATITIYVDGEPVQATYRGNAGPPLDVNNGLRLTIGTADQVQEPYRAFNGALAEIRLWSRARSAEEIAAGLSRRLAPGEDGLAGYWPGEFGLTVDVSANRAATHAAGMVTTATDGPPIVATSSEGTLFLFRGAYGTATKWGGNAGQWQPGGPLYVYGTGFVVMDDRPLANVKIAGNTLSWPGDGNPCAGSFTFKLGDNAPYYWPEGPQTRNVLEGWVQSGSGGAVDFRGGILPSRIGCGVLMNAGTALILSAGDGQPGTAPTAVAMAGNSHQHFCVYDDNMVLAMETGAALSVSGALAAGSRLVLAAADPAQPQQRWSFGTDGLMRPNSAPTLAVAVDPSQNPPALLLAAADPNDGKQRWLSLSGAQFLWNGEAPQVLAAAQSAGGAYDTVVGQAKANGSSAQLWYAARQTVFSDADGSVLALDGAPAVGTRLKLARFDEADTAQRFSLDGAHLVHVGSGLIVRLLATGGTVAAVLADAGDTSLQSQWMMAPTDDAATEAAADAGPGNQGREMRTLSAGDDLIDYVINIRTADAIAAGTDDTVRVALIGTTGSTVYVELKDSQTHSDPFERGQTDRFVVRLPRIGRITGVRIRYAENAWFWVDRWVLSAISVYDPTTLTTYFNESVGNGAQYEVPRNTVIRLRRGQPAGSDSTIFASKAPTQDAVTRGWVDHTWVVVQDTARTTYFDCAGGHGGEGTVDGIVTARCSLDQAVRMATGYGIDPSHPYQPVYGHDDVTGAQTCGVRASGFRNWDGQCHQMTNRLLYIGTPRLSLDDAPADKRPAGYGLSRMLWGRYGLGFKEWCKKIGIETVDDGADAVFDFIRAAASPRETAYRIMYHAVNMRSALAADPESPQGPDVKAFFQAVKNEGISNSTMAQLVCLPEEKVVQEQQP